jgi:hypothetical protein
MRVHPARLILAPLLASLVLAGCTGGSPGAAGRPTAPRPARVPSGWRLVSSLGLEVAAPADWPFNAWSGCGRPPPALVERDEGAVAGCGSNGIVPSVLRIRPLQSSGPGAGSNPPSQPETRQLGGGVTGAAARGRTPDGRYLATVQVPALQAEVSAESPDEAVVDAIVNSIRAVAVDAVGCATRLGAAPTWDRPAAGPAVALSHRHPVASIGVCHYRRLQGARTPMVLGSSLRLTGPLAAGAVAAIDQAAPGALPAVPARQCVREPESDPLWLHVDYAGAEQPVLVHVRYSTCWQRWTASPSGVSHVSQAQLQALLGPLRTGYGYANGVPPR